MSSKHAVVATATEYLSLDEILQADDTEYVDVEMPEWKRGDGSIGKVRLRTLTNTELVEYTESMAKNAEAKRRGNIELIVRSAIRPDGSALFSKEGAAALQEKSAKAFNRLAKAALKLNGVTDDEAKQAKND